MNRSEYVANVALSPRRAVDHTAAHAPAILASFATTPANVADVLRVRSIARAAMHTANRSAPVAPRGFFRLIWSA